MRFDGLTGLVDRLDITVGQLLVEQGRARNLALEEVLEAVRHPVTTRGLIGTENPRFLVRRDPPIG